MKKKYGFEGYLGVLAFHILKAQESDMIFGKTYSDRYREDQERLKELKGKWFYSFAWFPTKMSNGEWVWLEKYQWRYDISQDRWGTYVDNYEIIKRSMRTKEWVESKLKGKG